MNEYSWKDKFLAIAPKPFAILSLCGSVYIIKHISTSPKRRGAVFHRILLGLSFWDSMTSIAVFMGTWPIPAGTDGVYMASGTAGTCTAQGFWIQVGVGAPLYNASLSMYYFLVIFKGWKDHQMKKIEPFLHAVPILFSLSTATIAAATDSYCNSNVWCWIDSSNNGFRFGFFYGPVWAAMAFVTFAMVAIYCHFLVQERKTKKYSQAQERVKQRLSSKSNLERTAVQPTNISHAANTASYAVRNNHSSPRKSREIAGQAMFYVGSFYLTFLFPSWTRFDQMLYGSSPFAVIALFSVIFPMQGFFNACVYFRPRYLRYRKLNPDVNICSLLSKIWQNSCYTSGAVAPAIEAC